MRDPPHKAMAVDLKQLTPLLCEDLLVLDGRPAPPSVHFEESLLKPAETGRKTCNGYVNDDEEGMTGTRIKRILKDKHGHTTASWARSARRA